jgi:hypothetical protein
VNLTKIKEKVLINFNSDCANAFIQRQRKKIFVKKNDYVRITLKSTQGKKLGKISRLTQFHKEKLFPFLSKMSSICQIITNYFMNYFTFSHYIQFSFNFILVESIQNRKKFSNRGNRIYIYFY